MRIISVLSLNLYPKNIGVFEADSHAQALVKASRILSHRFKQAAIWLRNETRDDVNETDDLKAWKETLDDKGIKSRFKTRLEKRTNFSPHFDLAAAAQTRVDSKLFKGLKVRVLIPRTRGRDNEEHGTILFEPQQIPNTLPAGWQAPLNSASFIKGTEWGIEEALLHSSPPLTTHEKKPRRLNIIDINI